MGLRIGATGRPEKHLYLPAEIVARLERDAAKRRTTIKARAAELLDAALPPLPSAGIDAARMHREPAPP